MKFQSCECAFLMKTCWNWEPRARRQIKGRRSNWRTEEIHNAGNGNGLLFLEGALLVTEGQDLNIEWYVNVTAAIQNSVQCYPVINDEKTKENQSWIFTEMADAEAVAPVLWTPDGNGQLIGKNLNAGKDWRQEEKGAAEDEMVGWHH